FIRNLGQRPRNSCNVKCLALKARFNPTNLCRPTGNRSVESRLQRWCITRSESWGAAPGCYEIRAFGAKTDTLLVEGGGASPSRLRSGTASLFAQILNYEPKALIHDEF